MNISKSKHLEALIRKAYQENEKTANNLDLLSGYVWRYEGVDENMTFEEFFVGLLDGRFSNQGIIFKCSKFVKSKKQNE